MITVLFPLSFKSGVQGVEYCMERMIDTSMWASLSVTDIDDALVDADDILGILAEPAINDDSSLAEDIAAPGYALPSEVHPVLSLVPRSYQVEAMTAWLQHHG